MFFLKLDHPDVRDICWIFIFSNWKWDVVSVWSILIGTDRCSFWCVCNWDVFGMNMSIFGDGIFMLVWDQTTYIKVWFCWRGMMRCLFRWNGLKTVTCYGKMGGWMDGSMITSLNRGTSIDAITEISGVQRQFLGIRFCFDDLEEVSNLHAACIHGEVFICFTWSPEIPRRYPMDIITCKFHVEPDVCTNAPWPKLISLFGSPLPLHSAHILIHEGSGALVVKPFAQKETKVRS